jgi:hypothetical protein
MDGDVDVKAFHVLSFLGKDCSGGGARAAAAAVFGEVADQRVQFPEIAE